MGRRDFLVVNGQENYKINSNSLADASQKMNMNTEGFVMAWASIDDICEEIDGIQDHIEKAAEKENIKLCDYMRTQLRIGGYVCVPEKMVDQM